MHHRAAGSYCKPPPGQFRRTLENLIKILTSPDIQIYKLPSKVTFPLLGLLFLRGFGRRLWWVCLLSIRPDGAAADGQQIPELLVFNLHQHKYIHYINIHLIISNIIGLTALTLSDEAKLRHYCLL